MSDEYIHPNDRRNPDCLWPLAPTDAEARRSPVESALDLRRVFYYRLTSNDWLQLSNGLNVSLWPSREGSYLAAIGVQYAERRHEGFHTTSTDELADFAERFGK